MLTTSLLRVIEQALNRLLDLDPETPRRLQPLAGHSLAVRVSDPEVALRVRFMPDGVRVEQPDDAITDDAAVEATLAGLITLASSRGRRSRDVTFRGDVGMIQEVRSLFTDLEVDWEEQLARITGDIVAHQVGRGARETRAWGERTADSLVTGLGEYLTEESGLLPPGPEVEAFVREVDRLRADGDRLEARVRRLERRLRGNQRGRP